MKESSVILTGIGYKTIWNGREVKFECDDAISQRAFERAILKDVEDHSQREFNPAPSTPVPHRQDRHELNFPVP